MPAVEVLAAGEVSIRLRADELRVGDRLRLSLDVLNATKTGPIAHVMQLAEHRVMLFFAGKGITSITLPNDYAVSVVVQKSSLPRQSKPIEQSYTVDEIKQQSG